MYIITELWAQIIEYFIPSSLQKHNKWKELRKIFLRKERKKVQSTENIQKGIISFLHLVAVYVPYYHYRIELGL